MKTSRTTMSTPVIFLLVSTGKLHGEPWYLLSTYSLISSKSHGRLLLGSRVSRRGIFNISRLKRMRDGGHHLEQEEGRRTTKANELTNQFFSLRQVRQVLKPRTVGVRYHYGRRDHFMSPEITAGDHRAVFSCHGDYGKAREGQESAGAMQPPIPVTHQRNKKF